MSAADVRMFLSEVLCLAKFHHRHVLHLVGVSLDAHSHQPLVILPFMKHGDLLSYICSDRNVRDVIHYSIDSMELVRLLLVVGRRGPTTLVTHVLNQCAAIERVDR